MADIDTMDPRHAIGANRPPITAPAEQDVLEDLKGRFPELLTTEAELETAFKTFPKKLKLGADDDVAKALQDWIAQAKKHKTIVGAHKKSEKAPWKDAMDAVVNFFTNKEEKIKALLDTADEIHSDYLIQKRDAAEEAARAKAEAERKAAADAAAAAEAARQREAEARQAEEDARRREDEARAAAARAEEEKRAADARRAAAEEAERAAAAARRERDRAEKDRNSEALKTIRGHMKQAAKLHETAQAAGDEANPADTEQLDAIIRPGGLVSVVAGPVASSHLLDDAQTAYMAELKVDLDAMRKAMADRLDAKERRRREKARKEEEAREAARAEERRLAREEEDRQAEARRLEREAADKAAQEARDREKAAKGDVREAMKDQNAAYAESKAAGKDAKSHDTAADRHANRADRTDRKLENSTDADLSRTRGDFSVGSLKRLWRSTIVDEAALQGALVAAIRSDSPAYAILAGQFKSADFVGAVSRFMRLHQDGWSGRERVDDALAGVVFSYDVDGQTL